MVIHLLILSPSSLITWLSVAGFQNTQILGFTTPISYISLLFIQSYPKFILLVRDESFFPWVFISQCKVIQNDEILHQMLVTHNAVLLSWSIPHSNAIILSQFFTRHSQVPSRHLVCRVLKNICNNMKKCWINSAGQAASVDREPVNVADESLQQVHIREK